METQDESEREAAARELAQEAQYDPIEGTISFILIGIPSLGGWAQDLIRQGEQNRVSHWRVRMGAIYRPTGIHLPITFEIIGIERVKSQINQVAQGTRAPGTSIEYRPVPGEAGIPHPEK